MKKYKLAFILLIWSGVVSAIEVVTTMMPVFKNQFPVAVVDKEVPNMPRFRSQAALGLCFAFSSATVVQHYICQQNHSSCKSLDEKNEVSPLSMAAWANPNEKKVGNWEDHTNIRFAGMAWAALDNLTYNPKNTVTSESCFPFDQFANRYGFDRENVNKLIDDLNKQ
ncbi:MAG: hypothetical protein ACXW00_08670 [Methylobacter sp.]